MKVLTHVVAAEAAWFATAALFEIDYGVGAMAAAAAAALLPDIDYPKSWIGHIVRPLSEWLHERFGHRSFFHGLLGWCVFGLLLYPLLLNGRELATVWWAAMIGYGSHLWLDMMTLGGVKLFWPSDLIAIFPGRDEYRIKSGGPKETVFFVVVLALAIGLYPVSQAGMTRLLGGIQEADSQVVRVARVVDGDTITVDLWGVETKVRLIGVDTPETVAPGRPVGCYGPEASAFVKAQLEGQIVKLTPSTFGDARDVYGRLLAYVWVGEGFVTLVNEELLAKGYARTMRFSHDLQRDFSRVEREAREAGLGLWGAC